MTRTTTARLFCPANGVVEAPNLWQFDAFGTEEGEMMGRAIGGVTDVVVGRTLWQEWSQFWQGSAVDDPFAQFINPVRKHVVSRTLSGDLGWNSTVVAGDPAEYVRTLQQHGDGDVSVVGGITTTRSLFLAGVVDALVLTMHPVVTPEGRRLFGESVPVTRLPLVESRSTSAGNVLLTYALRTG